MKASTILKIDIACPDCGKLNSLTLGDVEAREIACSSCSRVLGAARQLAAAQDRDPPRRRMRAEACASEV